MYYLEGVKMQDSCCGKDNSTQNRRCYARFSIDAEAVLFINKNMRESSKVINICARGGCILSGIPVKVNDRIEIAIASVLNKPILLEAKVVWIKEISNGLWKIGIDFGLDNLLDLRDYVSSENI